MDYKQALENVKKQHPELSHKDAQVMASEVYQRFKNAADNFTSGAGPGLTGDVVPGEVISVGVSDSDLARAEKRILEMVPDINNICHIGREVIPDGELIRAGKEGVLTRVTWDNGKGRKLPEIGYFKIFI
jgi:hypothetical protein